MASPEQHRQRFDQLRRQKLFNPRDIEGTPNDELFATMRGLEEKLSKNPSFVGIVPYGSRMKGYSIATSDTDAVVLYDSTRKGGDKMRGYVWEIEEVLPSKHRLSMQPYDISREEIKLRLDGDIYPDLFMREVAFLFLPMKGPRVEEYRTLLREIIDEQPEDKRTKTMDNLTEALCRIESDDKLKRTGRLASSWTTEMITDQKRKTLWRERVELILKLRPHKTFNGNSL